MKLSDSCTSWKILSILPNPQTSLTSNPAEMISLSVIFCYFLFRSFWNCFLFLEVFDDVWLFWPLFADAQTLGGCWNARSVSLLTLYNQPTKKKSYSSCHGNQLSLLFLSFIFLNLWSDHKKKIKTSLTVDCWSCGLTWASYLYDEIRI